MECVEINLKSTMEAISSNGNDSFYHVLTWVGLPILKLRLFNCNKALASGWDIIHFKCLVISDHLACKEKFLLCIHYTIMRCDSIICMYV